MELSASLKPPLTRGAESGGMDTKSLNYDLGPAREVAAERPSIAELQRARAYALQQGDARRAAAYGLVVRHRIRTAQAAAAA
jgi:hypothetical protein